MWRPAGAGDEDIPRPLDRGTLHPDEEGTQSHRNVHRDDDKPHNPLEPPLREPEQGEGETRLGPYSCGKGKSTGEVDDFKRFGNAWE